MYFNITLFIITYEYNTTYFNRFIVHIKNNIHNMFAVKYNFFF